MNTPNQPYDYIFLGAGCASLSIIIRMIDSKKFEEKKILIIDKEEKIKNDRTWCFWEDETGYFEDIVYKKWNTLFFRTKTLNLSLDINPYQYKMIRGIDFYNHCFSKIKQQENIHIQYGNIIFFNERLQTQIKINDEILHTDKAIIFNSIFQQAPVQKNKFYLLQHFKGWIIETSKDAFDPVEATLMDFSVSQKNGTAFAYILPLSTNKALVEYTFFTKDILPQEEYDNALKRYVDFFLGIKNYTILEEEFGIIPMTNAVFKKYNNGIYNIGTESGQTKPSTGYTFKFIQKQATQIVQELIEYGVPSKKVKSRARFQFYDSTLLHILSKNKVEGKLIFRKLFKKNQASSIFKFLDNETNIYEEFKIIKSLPKRKFLIAGAKEFIKMIVS